MSILRKYIDIINEASKKKTPSIPLPVANPAPEVVFEISELYKKSLLDKRDNVQVKNNLEQFLIFKSQNPTSPYGKDEGFKNKNIWSNIRHSKLTVDISIFYSISGNNPHIIRLYGVFTHDESGTGQPARQNRQTSLVSKFSNQDYFPLK
jgi:hypothetical protein